MKKLRVSIKGKGQENESICEHKSCASCGFYEEIGIDGKDTGRCTNSIMKPNAIVDGDMGCENYVKVNCMAITMGDERHYLTIGRGFPWKHSRGIECKTIADAIYLRDFIEGLLSE